MSETQVTTVDCVRCGRTAPAATGITYGGALGREIAAKVCADCWHEWQGAEVMVINELRLNFMDPQALDTLIEQMREFLALGPAEGTPGP